MPHRNVGNGSAEAQDTHRLSLSCPSPATPSSRQRSPWHWREMLSAGSPDVRGSRPRRSPHRCPEVPRREPARHLEASLPRRIVRPLEVFWGLARPSRPGQGTPVSAEPRSRHPSRRRRRQRGGRDIAGGHSASGHSGDDHGTARTRLQGSGAGPFPWASSMPCPS